LQPCCIYGRLKSDSIIKAFLVQCILAAIAALAWDSSAAAQDKVPAAKAIDFRNDIQPLLVERCVRCHGPKKQEGGLRLDVRLRALQGGDTALAIDVSRPEQSEILKRITTHDEERRMPPTGEPLTPQQISLLRAWIAERAPWPDALAGNESHEAHWAFLPVKRPEVTRVQNPQAARSPIDVFVLQRLEAKKFGFAPEADRRVLIRRLSFDLIGLPPSYEETRNFVEDRDPAAYEKLVDRLLASKHFGERWGRHWLDLARFAESDGYENDNIRNTAWRFRDWVVNAVNADMPYDQFTLEQLAGDLLPKASATQVAATGFHRNTLYNSAASADKEEFRVRAVKDRSETTAVVWMGLTLGCAQCHTHKYDPISQREYYQLYAFFNNTDHQDVALPDGPAPALRETKRVSHVQKRGNFLDKGAEVKPQTPTFLPVLKARETQPDRLDLARWLASADHPLTARVEINRIWQHLFGQGLVATPENFGRNGAAPSHPQLLDWLASEFVRLKWSRKAMIKSIVLSRAYQQSSKHRADAADIDPDNRLLARQNRFRVEAEIVRDVVLDIAGLLDRKLGGPSVVPPFPDGLLDQKVTAESLKMPTKNHHRRGIYIHVQRTLQYPMLAAFDGADGNQPCTRRDRSTTPMQALTLLNDPVMTEAARALGQALRKEATTRDDRLRLASERCLGRVPTEKELAVLGQLVARQQEAGASDEAVWIGVARTLLNVDETVTRE
jgi:mono/diheme cytochrome c family protein